MQINPSAASEARSRYAKLGEEWIARFNCTILQARGGLSGRAYVAWRALVVPWPTTTRKRLYILAHEIGHVALDHRKQRPNYVQEFEAEQFAHGLMRQAGVAVPRAMTVRAKGYIRCKIVRAHCRFARWVDPDIAAWAGSNVVGINYCTPPEKQKHYYDASLRRVRKAIA